jgi:hypothetical protein
MLLANKVQFRKRKEIKKTKDKKFGPSTRRNKSRILDEKAEHAERLACPVVSSSQRSLIMDAPIAWFSSFRQCFFT